MTEFWFFEVLRGHFFRDRNLDLKKRIRIWFRLYKDCALKQFASKWFGYEYKVKLLCSRKLLYTRSISSSKRWLTPSVPIWGAVYLSENNANKTRPCAWTPSIIDILASTKDDQVSIIFRATYLYNL